MNQPAGFEDQDFSKLIDLEDIAAKIARVEETGLRFLAVMEEIFEMLGAQLQQDCGCCFEDNMAFETFLAPIRGNPTIGHIGCSLNPCTYFIDQMSTEYLQDGEAKTWYHISTIENIEGDSIDGGWVAASDIPVDLGMCEELEDVSLEYAIPDIDWDRYASEEQITFTMWPIDTQLLCGEHRAEIHGIGISEPTNIDYPQGLHHGIDLFVPPDKEDIVIRSVDHGIVVGIGIQRDSDEPDPSSHQPFGATQSEEGVGYSVIVRYGHLYVTYGHLSYIEDIWVGKEVQPGEALGTLGLNNERHLHFEVRSYGADDISQYSQGSRQVDPVSGIIPRGTSPSATSPPYIYDPIQFLPNPNSSQSQPISGVQRPEEIYVGNDSQFFESVSTEYIEMYGTRAGGQNNIYYVDVQISHDCIVRYMINLDPKRIETLNGYRGFVGYPSPTRNLVPPTTITNSSQ